MLSYSFHLSIGIARSSTSIAITLSKYILFLDASQKFYRLRGCTDLNEESEGLDLPPDCLGGSNTDPTSTETNPKAAKHKDPQNGLKDSEDSSNVLSYISVKMFFYWNFIKNNI